MTVAAGVYDTLIPILSASPLSLGERPSGRLPGEFSSPSGLMSVRDDLDLPVDAVDDVERTLVHLAFVLGDGAIFPFGQNDAGESADRFLDDVAARRNHRPC